jgi:hypothetical protein
VLFLFLFQTRPITVRLQSILGRHFYDIHGKKGNMLFFSNHRLTAICVRYEGLRSFSRFYDIHARKREVLLLCSVPNKLSDRNLFKWELYGSFSRFCDVHGIKGQVLFYSSVQHHTERDRTWYLSTHSYPNPTKWGRYNMFFIML